MVIDSIASPSGALSGCVKYYMKLTGDTAGTCFSAAPACSVNSGLIGGNTPASSNPATNGGCTWVCATAGQPKFRSIFTSVTLGGVVYRKIVLASGCQFSSSDTTYAVVGNYDFGGTRTCRGIPGGGSSATGPSSGAVGIFQDGGNTAWVAASFASQTLGYIYLEFCCGA